MELNQLMEILSILSGRELGFHTFYSHSFRPYAFRLHCELMRTALNTINYPINEKFNRSLYVKDC
jgi:hypothetical protein